MRKERGRKRKRVCSFCVDKVDKLNFRNADKLRRFLSDRSKILPRRISGNCARHQRQVTLAIKRARYLAMLPYSSE